MSRPNFSRDEDPIFPPDPAQLRKNKRIYLDPDPTLIRNEKEIFIYLFISFGFIQEFSWMEIFRQSIVVACTIRIRWKSNGSGSGSPKINWSNWIRIRIRIPELFAWLSSKSVFLFLCIILPLDLELIANWHENCALVLIKLAVLPMHSCTQGSEGRAWKVRILYKTLP